MWLCEVAVSCIEGISNNNKNNNNDGRKNEGVSVKQ